VLVKELDEFPVDHLSSLMKPAALLIDIYHAGRKIIYRHN
jgi:hypothetical protein